MPLIDAYDRLFPPFTFLKANNFFPHYAPSVGNFNRKIIGISCKGKPIKFTAAENQAISDGIDKMAAELKEMLSK